MARHPFSRSKSRRFIPPAVPCGSLSESRRGEGKRSAVLAALRRDSLLRGAFALAGFDGFQPALEPASDKAGNDSAHEFPRQEARRRIGMNAEEAAIAWFGSRTACPHRSVGGEAGQNPALLLMPKMPFRSKRTRMPSCSMMNSPVCPWREQAGKVLRTSSITAEGASPPICRPCCPFFTTTTTKHFHRSP
jgi:hypothetical protein